MLLPTDNMSYAIFRVLKILSTLILLLGFLVLYYSNITLNYICFTTFLISSFISLIFLRTQLIRAVVLRDDHLAIYYQRNEIRVPFEEINSIVSGLSSDFFKGKVFMIYRLDLNRKFRFGSKLYFKYNEHLDQNIDPQGIGIIREKINTLANSTYKK